MSTSNFGRIVRERRERKRLTITRAAEMTGLSDAGLALIELGDSNPKLSNVLCIAAALDIYLGDIDKCKPDDAAMKAKKKDVM